MQTRRRVPNAVFFCSEWLQHSPCKQTNRQSCLQHARLYRKITPHTNTTTALFAGRWAPCGPNPERPHASALASCARCACCCCSAATSASGRRPLYTPATVLPVTPLTIPAAASSAAQSRCCTVPGSGAQGWLKGTLLFTSNVQPVADGMSSRATQRSATSSRPILPWWWWGVR